MRKGLVIVGGIWLAVASCQEIKDCALQSSTEFAIIRFYEADSSDQTEKTVAFSLIDEPTSNLVISTMADTDEDDTITAVRLWLDAQASEVNYSFETDSITYELKILYEPHLRIYYDECDPVYSFKLDSVYSPNFDSVVISNRVLDRVVTTNVEVYF